MSKENLKSIIENFSLEKLIHFFRGKNLSFRPLRENLSRYNNEDFTSGEKLGEIKFQDNDLVVCSFQALKELTERTGKKRQYELGKRILKDANTDAGIFIFYDQNGNFRFSLIYTEYFGIKRRFSHFKRFTYFVSPSLTNKTFLKQIGEGDFSSFEGIKKAFSVEPVTKQFYQDIANWYFWAIKVVRFPDDAEKIPNGRNIAVIRLITRLMFIWFMKVRNLIPEELFDENVLRDILRDFDPYSKSSSSYYKAILQNLFFATLNTRQKERRFRSHIKGYKGFNIDFGNHNVYRYENLFKNSEEAIEKYFMPVPFLNGGLFECLDYKSKNKEERRYIDGFTDLKKYQPFVPNYLFFAEKEIVDLSEDYNDKKYKKTEVRGLIKTLQQYNFTIDENEPDDVEIALDPELLGKVFENLLASYNPETATTARKATGSYYTPREIVDYMVDESLKEYFMSNLPGLDKEKLEMLFSKEDTSNPFDGETTEKLINLIDSLRIVDPAVGSGAFPMRILLRLVFLLHKLDPDNSKWREIQIEGIRKSIKDPVLQNYLIEQIEKRFKEKNPDYGRKLYLIEKCIYGVDIQQIAVEIAKLRFFISLLVDEEIDFEKENCGIEPLPNLDFKIMQGNSLISSFYGIDFQQEQESTGRLFELDRKYRQLIMEFEELKNQYQNEPDVIKKRDLREKIDEKIFEIFEERLSRHLPELKQIEEKANQLPKQEQRERYMKEEKDKLFKNRGIDLEKAKEELIKYTEGRKDRDFFLWDIYFAEVFAEKGGFDIVIGNPPHGAKIDEYKGAIEKNFKFYERKKNSASLFIEQGFNLLKSNGNLVFIIPKSFTYVESWSGPRSFTIFSNKLLTVIDISKAFENVKLEQVIIMCKKEKPDGPYFFRTGDYWAEKINIIGSTSTDLIKKLDILPIYIDEIKLSIFNKIIQDSISLGQISYTCRGLGFQNRIKSDGDIPILRGDNIEKFSIYGDIEKITLSKEDLRSKKLKLLKQQKIVSQNIVAHIMNPFDRIKIMATIDDEGYLTLDTVMNTFIKDNSYPSKYILCILNSRLSEWFYYWFVYNRAIRTMHFDREYMGKLPIKKITPQNQPIVQKIENVVDKILSIKKQDPQADTSHLEREIDHLVYKLYNLTDEEIKIIEGL